MPDANVFFILSQLVHTQATEYGKTRSLHWRAVAAVRTKIHNHTLWRTRRYWFYYYEAMCEADDFWRCRFHASHTYPLPVRLLHKNIRILRHEWCCVRMFIHQADDRQSQSKSDRSRHEPDSNPHECANTQTIVQWMECGNISWNMLLALNGTCIQELHCIASHHTKFLLHQQNIMINLFFHIQKKNRLSSVPSQAANCFRKDNKKCYA